MNKAALFETTPQPRQRKLNPLPMYSEEEKEEKAVKLGRFPSWLHRKLPKGGNLWKTNEILSENRLHTVCEEAKCPNRLECFSKKTATFLVMGKECTRACGFCDIDFSAQPKPLDPLEPEHLVNSVKQLGLNHVVITMVARDDLPDGGAGHLAKILREVRHTLPHVTLEILTSDFAGNTASYDLLLAEKPEIFNYNIETVRSLTPKVRHTATYDRTLALLSYVRTHGERSLLVKSGIMVGFGEEPQEVRETLDDLARIGVDIITIGQYLQPNRHKLRVKEFVTPEQFKDYENYGKSVGIKFMYCGPFVRSSYNAGYVKAQTEELKL